MSGHSETRAKRTHTSRVTCACVARGPRVSPFERYNIEEGRFGRFYVLRAYIGFAGCPTMDAAGGGKVKGFLDRGVFAVDSGGKKMDLLTHDQIQSCADYVLRQTRYVIESFGPRDPGSAGETQAQAHVWDELKTCTDGDVLMEAFQVAPKAFQGFQAVIGYLMLCATAAYWVSPWLALCFSGPAIAIFILQFVCYRQLLDVVLRKRTSENAIDGQKPEGKIKRREILNAHPDAAYEWRFNCACTKLLPFITVYTVLLLFLKLVLDLSFAVFGGGWEDGHFGLWGALGLLHVLIIPACILSIVNMNHKVVGPGANDDLSGVFTVVGIAKQLREAGVRLADTEVLYAVTGFEEAGLRGAKAEVDGTGVKGRVGRLSTRRSRPMASSLVCPCRSGRRRSLRPGLPGGLRLGLRSGPGGRWSWR